MERRLVRRSPDLATLRPTLRSPSDSERGAKERKRGDECSPEYLLRDTRTKNIQSLRFFFRLPKNLQSRQPATDNRYEWNSIQKVATGRRAVTPALALRVARLAGVPMDTLLAGEWLSPRVCPRCGHPPDDFVDEDTRVG